MKLYEVPNNTRVRLVPETAVTVPVGSTLTSDEFKFIKIDGMYSYCLQDDGKVVHPACWTEVEICGKNTT